MFDNFPYTNFHELNLDWIIKIAKDFLDQYTHIQEVIENGEASLYDITEEGLSQLSSKATELEELLQSWYNTHSQDIADELASAIANLDTYAAGALTSFADLAEQKATETIASIPADYSDFVDIVEELPIFSADSENPPAVDFDIVRVVPSENVDTSSYKIGLRAIGKSGTKVLIAITKDCLDYATPNYSRLLAQLYVDITSIPDGFNTVKVPHVSGNATIDYYITLNCTKLKTLDSQNNTGVYFNTQYLNMERDIERNSNGLYKYTDCLYYVPYNYLDKLSYLKNIFVNVPGAVSDHEFYLYTFGYSTTYNRFYITLYDKTTGQVDCLAYKEYTSRPTSGIETIEFTNYVGGYNSDYKFIITVDWAAYNTTYFYEFASTDAPVIHPVNSDFSKVYAGSGTITGIYYLNSEITLFPNQHIVGNECRVVCTANAKINMADNSSIEGIEFTGAWTPTRTHGDGTTYTQYGYVPLISLEDLENGTESALYGDGVSVDDAIINISYLKTNVTIKGCIFRNFNKPVIFAGGQQHEHDNSPFIIDNHFIDCRLGVAVYGQFEHLYGNQYLRCVIGSILHDGNSNQIGEEYTCCDCGIYFPDNAGAHNEITSIHICHCGLCGIYIKEMDTNLGATITGSHIADAPIIGEDVSNLLITSSRLDTFFNYETGQRNSIVLNNIRTAYLYGNPLYTVPSDTQITLNRGMGSTTDTEVNS